MARTRAMSRAWPAALLVAGVALWLSLPSAAPALPMDSFAEQARAAKARARYCVRATEEATPPRHYAYYTVDDAWWEYAGPGGWASGFVPGALWSGYQMTGGSWWRDRALARQRAIGAADISAESLNLGGLFVPSFVRGYTLTGDPALRDTALFAAAMMSLRYDPAVGAMRSRPGAEFNVIIDSLMKSQLLWWAAKNGGPWGSAEIARQHALTIARDLVREDGSTWHMALYDTTGAVSRHYRGSAYSEDSTWARGQAWAILGFAAAYRETRDPQFLAVARKVTDWYLAHLPEDLVPYWDFGDPLIPAAPRDSSSAAIAASGMIDLALAEPSDERRASYLEAARATLASLMSPAYLSLADNPAVLLHGTYTFGSGIVDRGLAYGDAFFLEALLRLRRASPGVAALPLVRARAEKGRLAAAAVDGDLTTSWASRGLAALDVRLAGRPEVGAVRVALEDGDRRAAVLRVLLSGDGRLWRPVLRTVTSGETTGFETLDFVPARARWVRIVCDGTSTGPINRIAEVRVLPAL